MTTVELRKTMRQKRRKLTDKEQRKASETLREGLIQQLEFTTATSIAAYIANDGEIDLQPVLTAAWQAKKRVYLPALHPFTPGCLIFCRYFPDTELTPNRYGIPEPPKHCNQVIPVAKLDLMLLPLVAFDQSNNRLGMGGGYYDRSLAALKRPATTTKTIGVAHKCQQVDRLDCQPWDIAMQKIIAV